ncbi:uncharacterized protein Bfra_001216 [Botrytis fragariae]|uniref:2EXR domain-containing protein n=1 Tax=Botrytis fragariae TaxID=1964551 RepID=A0A8H6B056_9HELO|nr:uncharacterized protein Bfra_001216 [Botrytis fragariae]KAF5876861.1 hypothetical protein Bfra_001216 [Botrytis fragariae]
MDPENKLTPKRCKKLSGQALADELQKRRSKHYRALERRWRIRIPRRQLINLRKFPMRKRHSSPSSFVLFSELPIEIRIKIWKYSFRGHNVEVCVDFDISVGYDASLQIEVLNYPPRIFQCRTITQSPITLFVNHESRTESLKYYCNLLPGVSDFPIYFNYQLDSFTLRHYFSKHNIRGCDTMEQLSWGITHLIDISSSVLLRPMKSLTFPTCFIYDYGIVNPHRPQPQGNTYSVFIEPFLTEFDCLEEIIIISGRPEKNSQCSGFDNSVEVQHLENCLTHTFEAEMERNASFQIPNVTIHTEPFLLPMFRDEMEQANDSRVYEN